MDQERKSKSVAIHVAFKERLLKDIAIIQVVVAKESYWQMEYLHVQ